MTQKSPRQKSPNIRRKRTAREIERKGRAILRQLATTLAKRGVPADRYVKVDIETGEFVTGKSLQETDRRFAQMHPGVVGWSQRFGELLAESDIAQVER